VPPDQTANNIMQGLQMGYGLTDKYAENAQNNAFTQPQAAFQPTLTPVQPAGDYSGFLTPSNPFANAGFGAIPGYGG
jgi:hypothetical protein